MMQIENFWSLWWFIFCHLFAKINFLDFIIKISLLTNFITEIWVSCSFQKAIFDNLTYCYNYQSSKYLVHGSIRPLVRFDSAQEFAEGTIRQEKYINDLTCLEKPVQNRGLFVWL